MGNTGSTALHKAANDKDLAKLRWEVQQHPTELNVQERDHGWTALHVAAARGFDPAVRELLARGARHDIQDKDGRTPLHLAAEGGYVEVVRDLLRRGASPAVRDKSGAAPYDYAVERHPTIAALLGGPPPPPPAAPPQAVAPPPPPPAQYGALPPVDVASAGPANKLLPPPPPAAAPVSTGIGGTSFPRVHHDRAPADILLQAPPPLPTALYPAGPPAAAAVYETPSAPPAPLPYGYGAAAAAPPPPQQQQQQPGAYVPYPTVPGLKAPAAPQRPSGGTAWPGGGAAAAPPPPPPPLQVPPVPPSPQAARGPDTGGQPANPADLDWAPTPRSDWGGEPARPDSPPPRRPGFNPILSARFQLEKLLGAGLSQLGLTGQPAGGGGRTDPRVGGGGSAAASGASAASGGSLSSLASPVGGRVYSYEQLRVATGGFSPLNKLGEGGYGPVYRGSLDGIPVAVKVMDASEGALQGRAEFEAEVAILSSLHHPHVVLLIGSCPEKGMLVYELMTNSSLEYHLFGHGAGRDGAPTAATAPPPAGAGGAGGGRPPVSLPWRDRVRIAAEVASALLFLHSAPTPIVHMDLKPANVLLDEHLTAKLGDVGLARLAPVLAQPAGPAGAAAAAGGPRSTVKDSRLVGTFEYMDPEYLRSGEYSARSDVYALGMVLLQLLTGRGGAQVVSLVESARQQPLGFAPIIDPRAGPWPAAEAVAFADLALRCVEYRRQDRPDLRSVILPTLMQLKQRTALYEPQPAPAPQAAPGPQDGLPPMFICPITQDVMEEPVVAADGYTYERLAIQEWISRAPTSPLTNMRLAHTNLVDNLTLRSAIREWREQQQGQQQQGQGAGQQAAAAPPPRRTYDDAGW